MVFISCAATALRKREIKPSKSTSVASWVGFTFAGFFAWAAVFLGGVLQPPAARPNNNRTKARNLTPAFIGDTFVSFSREWQVHHDERCQMEGALRRAEVVAQSSCPPRDGLAAARLRGQPRKLSGLLLGKSDF